MMERREERLEDRQERVNSEEGRGTRGKVDTAAGEHVSACVRACINE